MNKKIPYDLTKEEIAELLKRKKEISDFVFEQFKLNKMNRKIKFRVWCNTTRHFTDIPFYSCSGGQLLWHHTGNEITISNIDEGDYEVQQFTGLKDKNGKDIYEGDIIKATSDQYENENFVGKVIFDEGSYLTWINKNDIRGINEDDFEVIGNIFDNPELLKL